MTMTYRAFLTAVAATETASADVKAFATAELVKLDQKNQKRRTTETAAQKEATATITTYVAGLLHREVVTAGMAAAALGVTTQKASALLKKGVALGILEDGGEVKTTKGKVRGYIKPAPADEDVLGDLDLDEVID